MSETTKPIYVWVGIGSCGCVRAATYDAEPQTRDDSVARDIGHMTRDGLKVERVIGPVNVGPCKHKRSGE